MFSGERLALLFLLTITKKSIFYLRISKKSSTFALRLEKHTKLEHNR